MNLSFMASHDSDEENEVSNLELNDTPSYDELHDAFKELHAYALTLSRIVSNQRKKNIFSRK